MSIINTPKFGRRPKRQPLPTLIMEAIDNGTLTAKLNVRPCGKLADMTLSANNMPFATFGHWRLDSDGTDEQVYGEPRISWHGSKVTITSTDGIGDLEVEFETSEQSGIACLVISMAVQNALKGIK